MACSHAKGERLSPVIFPVKGGAYNMRLDGLLFFFHLWRCCSLKLVSRVKSPSKSSKKTAWHSKGRKCWAFQWKRSAKRCFFFVGGVQRKHELCPTTWYLWLQTSCFFCVPATTSILSVFSCLPYPTNLCYTTLLHHREYIFHCARRSYIYNICMGIL